jgi:hypothetical protein
MRAVWIVLAVLAVAGCGGDEERSSATSPEQTYTEAQVIEAFAAVGWTVAPKLDDGCGPSEEEQEELGITVMECREGSFTIGRGRLPKQTLYTKGPGTAPFSVLLYASAGEAEKAVGDRSSAEIVPGRVLHILRRGNVVVVHDAEPSREGDLKRALDLL